MEIDVDTQIVYTEKRQLDKEKRDDEAIEDTKRETTGRLEKMELL